MSINSTLSCDDCHCTSILSILGALYKVPELLVRVLGDQEGGEGAEGDLLHSRAEVQGAGDAGEGAEVGLLAVHVAVGDVGDDVGGAEGRPGVGLLHQSVHGSRGDGRYHCPGSLA